MTPEAAIVAEAARRYPIGPSCCRTQKMALQGKREAFIKREREKLKQAAGQGQPNTLATES